MDSALLLRRVCPAFAGSLLATLLALSACAHPLLMDVSRRPRDSRDNSRLPYGIPVPGKPGYVSSPYASRAASMDVKGKKPGQRIHDPVNHKVFLVP